MESTQIRKAERLLELHAAPEILVLLNTSDAGSARVVEEAGYPAIATSSAGIAWLLGYADGEHISRGDMLGMVRRIAAAVAAPVTADMEGGYGDAPETVAETIRLTIEAGAVGANLEDASSDPSAPLLELPLAVDKVRAARQAADAAGIPLVLNARTDPFLRLEHGPQTLGEAIRRGNAYREAGADCIFVPGAVGRETIATLVREIDGPINILANAAAPPVPELEGLGVARLSVGSLGSLAAMTLFRRVAKELREAGTFSFADGILGYAEVNALFS